MIRPRRSVLYMPGSNARALEKAAELPADGLILDLEDAVAPDAKETARVQVMAAVASGRLAPREVVVRINALTTPWGEDDLAAVAASGADAVLVPKVDDAEAVFAIGRRLARLGAAPGLQIWVMVETARAVLDPGAIAAAREEEPGRRLSCLVLGTNDLLKETRARSVPGRAPLVAWLSATVAAGRAYGLDVLDGVFNGLDDEAGFAAECAQGRDLGMDGKTLIHPRQIATANATFGPSEAEVASARAIVAAFERPENRGKGVLVVDGRMVERLHAEAASRVLALAEAIAARG